MGVPKFSKLYAIVVQHYCVHLIKIWPISNIHRVNNEFWCIETRWNICDKNLFDKHPCSHLERDKTKNVDNVRAAGECIIISCCQEGITILCSTYYVANAGASVCLENQRDLKEETFVGTPVNYLLQTWNLISLQSGNSLQCTFSGKQTDWKKIERYQHDIKVRRPFKQFNQSFLVSFLLLHFSRLV